MKPQKEKCVTLARKVLKGEKKSEKAEGKTKKSSKNN